MKPILVTIVAVAALATACSSSTSRSSQAAPKPSPQSSVGTASATPSAAPSTPYSNPYTGSVYGIPIPGQYSTSPVPPVASPKSCPAAFAKSFKTMNQQGTTKLTSSRTESLLTCLYTDANPVATGCTQAKILINTEPDAYKAFYRWTVEVGQNAMWSTHPERAPRPVAGIGVLAEWIPGNLQFETGSTNTWVAVFLTCARTTPKDALLAEAMGRAGLASTASE